MTRSHSLSVVLPNYNHARLLPRALDALLAQERPAEEILVIDDGSSDASRAVIHRYASAHPSISALFNDRNRGAPYTLQRGLEAATGRYVCFAAADDYVLPGFFQAALEILERYPEVGLCCCDTALVDGRDGRRLGFRPVVRPLRRAGALDPAGVEQLLKRADNFIVTGSSLVRRDLALQMGGFDTEAGSFTDGLLTRKIALAHGLCYLPRLATSWNIFPDGMSRTTVHSRRLAIDSLTAIPAKIAADAAFPSWYPALFKRRLRFGLARLLIATSPVDRWLVRAVAAPTRIDRMVLFLLLPLGANWLGRVILLAWLAIRFRPYRMRDVLITGLAHRRACFGR
jgi:glycosyltransferase involved in cell wall biosynthesis